MGKRGWPDDAKVGNGPAYFTVGCLFIPFIALGLSVLLRWAWPHLSSFFGWG